MRRRLTRGGGFPYSSACGEGAADGVGVEVVMDSLQSAKRSLTRDDRIRPGARFGAATPGEFEKIGQQHAAGGAIGETDVDRAGVTIDGETSDEIARAFAAGDYGTAVDEVDGGSDRA